METFVVVLLFVFLWIYNMLVVPARHSHRGGGEPGLGVSRVSHLHAHAHSLRRVFVLLEVVRQFRTQRDPEA